MGVKEQTANVSLGVSRNSWEAKVIRACRECKAPGVYKDHPSIRDGWPECYVGNVPNTHDGMPVGPYCPQCGAKRPLDEDQGELVGSMPRWVWKCILAFKWCLIKWRSFRLNYLKH